MKTRTQPKCMGFLFDQMNKSCQACLVQAECVQMMSYASKETQSPEQYDLPESMPKDKKALVLAICQHMGLDTWYTARSGAGYDVCEDNLDDFINIDFLLTSKKALQQMYCYLQKED